MPPSRNAYGVKPKISGVDINGFPEPNELHRYALARLFWVLRWR
jgi:hypothetical protein